MAVRFFWFQGLTNSWDIPDGLRGLQGISWVFQGCFIEFQRPGIFKGFQWCSRTLQKRSNGFQVTGGFRLLDVFHGISWAFQRFLSGFRNVPSSFRRIQRMFRGLQGVPKVFRRMYDVPKSFKHFEKSSRGVSGAPWRFHGHFRNVRGVSGGCGGVPGTLRSA